MPAVVNSGPLIALAKLNHLQLLVRLYGSLFVPQGVYDEVVIAPGEVTGARTRRWFRSSWSASVAHPLWPQTWHLWSSEASASDAVRR